MSRQLPEGWREVRLGDIYEFSKGKFLSKKDMNPDGKYKCIHYGELFTKYPANIKKVISRTDNISNAFYSQKGDVLMPSSDVTPNGLATASVINEDDVILGGDIIVIRNTNKLLNGLFLAKYIRAKKPDILRLVSGITVFHIYASDLSKFVVLLPPHPEQKAIASLLETWDEAIDKTEALIVAKEKRFEWLLKRLTKPKNNWNTSKIGNSFHLGRGRVISKQYLQDNQGAYPVFSSQTSNNGEFGRINTFDFEGRYITWTTDGANAGKVFFRSGKFNCTNVCGTAKPIDENEIDANFIAYYLQEKTSKYVSYVGNPKLMNGIFRTIPIHYPSIDRQKSTAHILNTARREIDLLKQLVDRYHTQKRGLMQKLLTGQWRLTPSFPPLLYVIPAHAGIQAPLP